METDPVITLPMSEEDGISFELIELFFFAYRDFVADPDSMLAKLSYGRAHHRVLHFVNRNPGIPVANLLGILKITKQSIARVLKQLIEDDYIAQQTGATDRRQRLLFPTQKGRDLALELSLCQAKRIEDALKTLPQGTKESSKAFLYAMIEPQDRPIVRHLNEGLETSSSYDPSYQNRHK
ncbi:MarR family winged helix-turn-helix transcriptional regulator [Cohaesibacter celericrescens]|uniref:MarR family transcriptional regulator n=1 Tax=Cohaesibacter celericrescens TaxID=2067669 RepID=A0A2N5XXN9_9HYPH|nr:MarR family winged helix-turn-helix transcriptional regulator [Cohaesibacter celericrescens]PLW79276.1 MarR family transcriptional regulator [Cohaesibacter celericrescens]